ncbi:hypothetical protein NIES970_29070 (plasmid) [[Synechococcus] sp. NIES-970]|nr:hypothetical protein NIES970_29070 [[Synechococcus] sp. NIES-970]
MANQNLGNNYLGKVKDCFSIITLLHENLYFWQKIKGTMGGLFHSLLDIFTYCNEPRISRKISRYGDIYFEVYDPVSNQNMNFGSEQEVKMWLEQKYYH